MPAERVSMRRVRENPSTEERVRPLDRAIAVAVGVARSTVRLCLDRVAAAGLSWPLPATVIDQGLEALLFAPLGGSQPGHRHKAEPDWTAVHHELRRPGVTLLLLWEEYRTLHSSGYGYSRWCELYRSWESRLSPTMRQTHQAGERLFVDYAGQTVAMVVDASTGELRAAQVFVAVLGASNYTYAEATWTQSLPDWIGSHVRALSFLGGVPRQIVPDNLRAGVLRANWYEPGINRATATWRRTMARRSCRRGCADRATRPRLKPACWWSSAGSWRGCATSASSPWPSSMRRSQDWSPTSTLGRCASWASAAASCSSNWTSRHYYRCRRNRSSMPSGESGASRSTTTSTSTATTTRCRTGCCASRSRPASPRAPSSCSTGASGSRCICAVARAVGTPPCPSTCRGRTGGRPSGRSRASARRQPRSARRPRD